MTKAKIAIFGSREINEEQATNVLLSKLSRENHYISSGNISGVANIAQKLCKRLGITITLYNYLTGTGLFGAVDEIAKKNKEMVSLCDSAIVVWNGSSSGTKKEIEMLKKAGKPYSLDVCSTSNRPIIRISRGARTIRIDDKS
jgi:selenophosphate synthase